MRRWLAVLLLLAGTTSAGGQEAAPSPSPTSTPTPAPPAAAVTIGDVTIAAAVKPAAATVGDVLDYEVVVDAPDALAVAEPNFTADPSPFDLREAFVLVTQERSGGRTKHVFRARLALFEIGARTLPAAEVAVRAAGAGERHAVPAVGVLVASVLPPGGPTPSLKDVKGVMELPGRIPVWLLVTALSLVVLLLAYILWRRRSVVLPAAPREPELPCDERALHDLKQLVAGPLLPSGRIKEFYVRLSEIVRAYLGSRFGFDALEMTTAELSAMLRDKKVASEVRDLVREVAAASDLVKFARHRPDDAGHKAAIQGSYRLIESTRPRPPARLEPVTAGRDAS